MGNLLDHVSRSGSFACLRHCLEIVPSCKPFLRNTGTLESQLVYPSHFRQSSPYLRTDIHAPQHHNSVMVRDDVSTVQVSLQTTFNFPNSSNTHKHQPTPIPDVVLRVQVSSRSPCSSVSHARWPHSPISRMSCSTTFAPFSHIRRLRDTAFQLGGGPMEHP